MKNVKNWILFLNKLQEKKNTFWLDLSNRSYKVQEKLCDMKGERELKVDNIQMFIAVTASSVDTSKLDRAQPI